LGGELRISLIEGLQARLAMIGEQILQAPRLLGLERDDLMAARLQFAKHAAQKVRVAVVPAALQRMGEIADLHAAALACVGARPSAVPINGHHAHGHGLRV
jgi:hypothetical protein